MAKGRGGFSGMGGMNMQAMMKQAQKMQADMLKAQEELANQEYEAAAGGGAVVAKVKGNHELVSLAIQPEVVDPDDVEMLQDLILAAVNEALRTAEASSAEQMKKATGGMNIPGMPGLL